MTNRATRSNLCYETRTRNNYALRNYRLLRAVELSFHVHALARTYGWVMIT